MFIGLGTVQYTGVFDAASHGEVSTGLATLVTLLMLVGVTGKSAQIPLYVWLPDAMAGPTPVSALIHAATMVTAGVYLIARSHPLFVLVPDVQQFVGVLGAATAFLAGSIAIAQFDIKKVLAYSTVSQLGFMVSAVGLGATVAGIFHLMTHAFFKGLLFLGAGSVIHGMEHGMHHENAHGDPQDMRNMGGLWSKMRTTAITYIIAALALGGVFPFAGFWSKDEILFEVQKESPLAYWLLVIAAAFTAFYMTRQVLMVFFGKPRHQGAEHAVESSRWMTIPLMILAFFAAIAGFVNVAGGLTHWLAPEEQFAGLNAGTALMSTGVAVLAIVVGYLIYRPRPTVEGAPDDPLRRTGLVFSLLNHKYWIDELYDRLVVRPFTWLANFLAMVVDGRFWHDFFHDTIVYGGFMALTKFLSDPIDTLVIDGAVNGTGRLVAWVSGGLRKVQTGFVRNYALMMLGGAAIVIAWFALMALRGS
jgi:NADH-quinone oxidoreductase subunit L